MLPVYVRTGLLWEDAEIHWLERFLTAARIERCERLTVLELPVDDLYGEHWSMTDHGVPGLETTLDCELPSRPKPAAAFQGRRALRASRRGRVAMAPLSSNPFPDGTPEFFRAFPNAASAQKPQYPVRVNRASS